MFESFFKPTKPAPEVKQAPLSDRIAKTSKETPWGLYTEQGDLDLAYAGTVLDYLAQYLQAKGTPREGELLKQMSERYSDGLIHEQFRVGLEKLHQYQKLLKVDPEMMKAAEDMIAAAIEREQPPK